MFIGLVLSSRVHPVHLRNVGQRQADKDKEKTKRKTIKQSWVREGSLMGGVGSMVRRISGNVKFKFNGKE